MADLGSAEVVLTAKVDQLLTGVNAAVSSLEKLGKQAEKSGVEVSKIGSVFSGIQGTFLKFNVATQALTNGFNIVAAGAKKLGALAGAGDGAKKLNAELSYLLGSTERAGDAMKRFWQIAEDADLSVAQVQNTFKKLATQTKLSNNEMESLITTYYQANKVMGKSTEEGAAGMNQLALAIQRGGLSTEQLGRAFRQSPVFIRILTEGLKVTGAQLTKMAEDGKLTADVLVKAFKDAGPAIAKAAEGMPKTWEEFFESMERRVTRFEKAFWKALMPDSSSFEGMFKGIIDATDKAMANIILFVTDAKDIFNEYRLAVEAIAAAFLVRLIPAIGAATIAMAKLALAHPVTAIALGVVALAVHWKEVKEAIEDATAYLEGFFDVSGNVLKIVGQIAKILALIAGGGLVSAAKELKELTSLLDDNGRAEVEAIKRRRALNKEIEEADQLLGKMMSGSLKTATALEDDFWSKNFGDLDKLTEDLKAIPKQIQVLESRLASFKANMQGSPEDLAWVKGAEDKLKSLYALFNSGDPTAAFREGLKFLKQDLSIGEKINILIAEIWALEEAADPAKLKNIEALKELLKSLKDQENKASSGGTNPWQSFIDGIKNFGKELDLVPKKIEYLQAELVKASAAGNFPMVEKLKKDIESLQQTLASGNPIELFRLSLENLGKGEISATAKIDILKTKLAELQLLASSPETDAAIKQIDKLLGVAKDEKAAGEGMFAVAMRDIEKSMVKAHEARQAYDQLKETLAGVNKELQPELWARISSEMEKMKNQTQLVKTDMEKLGESITDAIASNANNAVNSFIDSIGTAKMSFTSFATSVLKDIAKMIVQMLVMKPLMDSIRGFMGGLGGGHNINGQGWANGGAFGGGTGLPHGVYTQPTLFKYANGGVFGSRTGLMGEAGPEAILPLHRGAGGKLGVAATPSNVQVNVYNEDKNTKVETASTTSPDGSVILDIRIAKKVNEMFAGGSMDKTMRSNYGLTRQPA